MDTNKLFKAIQLVVKEEVKKQTAEIKEQVRKEILAEIKKTNVKTPISDQRKMENPFDRALAMLEEDRHVDVSKVEQKQYVKNPTLNQILNETTIRPNFSRTDDEWGTITPDMIGYGDPMMGYQSEAASSIPTTGNDLIDKAIARSAKVLAASKDKNR
jgi:hypothetical protein